MFQAVGEQVIREMGAQVSVVPERKGLWAPLPCQWNLGGG